MPIGATTVISGFFKGLFGFLLRLVAPLIAYRKGKAAGRKEAIAEKTEADLKAMQVRQKHEDEFAKRSDDENRAEVGKWAKKS